MGRTEYLRRDYGLRGSDGHFTWWAFRSTVVLSVRQFDFVAQLPSLPLLFLFWPPAVRCIADEPYLSPQ